MSKLLRPHSAVLFGIYAAIFAVLVVLLNGYGTAAQNGVISIRLTDHGFEPPQVTVRVGSTVEIINDTAVVQTVTAQKQFNVYLPAMLVRSSGAAAASAANEAQSISVSSQATQSAWLYLPVISEESSTAAQTIQEAQPSGVQAAAGAPSIFSKELAPGEHYQFVVTDVGQVQLLLGDGNHEGAIKVVGPDATIEPSATPSRTLTPTAMSTDATSEPPTPTGSATSTPTATATLSSPGDTLTPTTTATASPPVTASFTPTSTPTATATPTASSTPTSTSTNTPTPTATATAVIVINPGPTDVCVSGTQINGNTTWGASGSPYIVKCNLTVNAGVTLTLQAGVVVKMYNTASLFVNGGLVAQGTAAAPVYITSLKDDTVGGDSNNDGSATAPVAGDWYNLVVGNNAQVVLDYTRVRYGGNSGSSYDALLTLFNNARATVNNSTLSNSANQAIYMYPSTTGSMAQLTVNQSTLEDNGGTGIYATSSPGANVVTVTGSTIRNNYGSGINLNSVSSVTITGNNITGNTGYGLYASSASIVNAENNWWGSDSGPAPYGSGNKINYQTCYDSTKRVYYICKYYVDADPWIGKQVFVKSQLGSLGPRARNQAREADPVNTANGNFSYSYTDISIPTRGLPLNFARTYNSLAPTDSPLGWGWTHSWNIYLTQNADSSITVTFGDGHGETWLWNGSIYTGMQGVYSTLVRNGDGTFDLTTKAQTRFHFSASGRLDWVEDKNGNRTTLAYDAQNRLVTITEPTGRTLTLAYASPVSAALVSAVTASTGGTVRYSYSAAGDLVSVTDLMNQATAMTYNADHRVLTMTDANNHTFVNNTYDDRGRVSEQRDAANSLWTFAYDEEARKTIVTSPRSYATTYEYTGEWLLAKETDALNKAATFAYDANFNRVQTVDRRGFTTTLAYDGSGNVTTVVDTLGNTTRMTYDSRSNLLTQTDALNRVTTNTYDAKSNLVQTVDALGNTVTWNYNAQGQVTSQTDASGSTTTYTYDGYGYPASVTDALLNVTSYVYDATGRKLSETDALNRGKSYTYDAANRLLAVAEPLGKVTQFGYDVVGNRTAITDALGYTARFTYDAKDRLVSTTDPLNHTTSFGYDVVDNRTVITNALGYTTTFTYDALNRQTAATDALGNKTQYGYDANGNRTSMTDAKGYVTTYTLDAMGRLVSVTDAKNGTVSYTYDVVGNRTSMTDANAHTTTYGYDVLNRLVTTTDPLNYTVSYGYDAKGNRTRKTKADGQVIIYNYDELNRLVGTSYSGGAIAYGYDKVGRRIGMTDTLGVTSYTYDALDRMTQVTSPNGTLDYGYDLNGNRTALTYPGSKTLQYAFDAANRLTTVTDWANRTTTYTYDAANRQTGIAYPNGVQAVSTYDKADRLLSIVHTSPVEGVIAKAVYTLDAAGNRMTMVDLDGTTSYTYDQLHRLTGVTYPNGEVVTYTYDPMGNRLAMTSSVGGTTGYSYDAGDRLLSYVNGANTTNLTWDANGNMTGKGGTAYTFNVPDRLTQVVAGTMIVQYGYDGDGTRQSKSINGIGTTYLQDVYPSLPVVVMETSVGQSSQYVHGNELLTQVDPTGPTYYHVDGLGSIRALSNLSGQRTDAYTYDAFGATRVQTGNSRQTFMYTGEEYDSSSGLIYLRARYFASDLGRFISHDVYPLLVGDTQTINRYSYVQNNPIRLADPSGNAWYDFLSAEKNGINDGVRAVWNNTGIGGFLVDSTPVVKDIVDTAEGMDQYASNRRRSLELITADMTEADQQEFDRAEQAAMQGLSKGLSSAAKTASAPCTSLNPSCGLTDFAPKPIGDFWDAWHNPFLWLLGQGKDAITDPIYDLPSLAISHQLRPYSNTNSASAARARYRGGSWGSPPGRYK